jgi:hypothetical protein
LKQEGSTELSESSDENIFGAVVKKDGWRKLSKSVGKKSGSDISWPKVMARAKDSKAGNFSSYQHMRDLAAVKTKESLDSKSNA